MTAVLAAAARVISGAVVEWRCDPHPTGPRIYFANHSSHLDFVVIWSALPPALRPLARPVAGRDYWAAGPIRRYLADAVFHAVLIDRAGTGDPVTARLAIERMAIGMGEQYSLIVFPEGTRTCNGAVGAFKSGLFHLARRRPDAELIPIHLENLNRILPKGEVLPVPMLSRVVFGPPLCADTGLGKPAFLAAAREALLQLGAAR
jgi:1-acyl-sn-glycerol-3-phosphate acyltransferase